MSTVNSLISDLTPLVQDKVVAYGTGLTTNGSQLATDW